MTHELILVYWNAVGLWAVAYIICRIRPWALSVDESVVLSVGVSLVVFLISAIVVVSGIVP